MRVRIIVLTALLALASLVCVARTPHSGDYTAAVVQDNEDAENLRVEGEQRFRANCSRCHAAPHKFPPRMMATIVRHMRVRATITDEDMRAILFYMTR